MTREKKLVNRRRKWALIGKARRFGRPMNRVGLSARSFEAAFRDLCGQCVDEVAEFTPEQYAYLSERMRAEIAKNGPLVLFGQKGRAAD